MGRLESHRSKEQNKNIFLAGLALAVLLYFIFSYGIKILLNTAAFISTLSQKNKNENYSIKKDDYYGTIDIDSIQTATNSSSIRLTGQVNNFDMIEIFLNDRKIDEKDVDENFNILIDNLEEGNNEIYLIALSKEKKTSKKTGIYTVLYKKEKPRLEIVSPKDGEKTNDEEIKIAGKTNKEVFIEINSLPVVVNALGEFESAVKLSPGENKIEIVAQDIAGNVETKQLKVIYEKE